MIYRLLLSLVLLFYVLTPRAIAAFSVDINENESDSVASVKQTWACDPVEDPGC